MKALPRTHSTTFGSIGPNAPKLFSVADGVTLDAALETASNLTEGVLDIARGVACQIDRADGAAGLWAGIHALESVAAILEAIQAGLLDLEHPEPTAAPCAKPDPADDPEVLRRVLLPDGSPYVNDDKTWEWMSEQALKAARFLGYVCLMGCTA